MRGETSRKTFVNKDCTGRWRLVFGGGGGPSGSLLPQISFLSNKSEIKCSFVRVVRSDARHSTVFDEILTIQLIVMCWWRSESVESCVSHEMNEYLFNELSSPKNSQVQGGVVAFVSMLLIIDH